MFVKCLNGKSQIILMLRIQEYFCEVYMGNPGGSLTDIKYEILRR